MRSFTTVAVVAAFALAGCGTTTTTTTSSTVVTTKPATPPKCSGGSPIALDKYRTLLSKFGDDFQQLTAFPPAPVVSKDAEQEKFARDAANYLARFHDTIAGLRPPGHVGVSNCALVAEIADYRGMWAAVADAYAAHNHKAADEANQKLKAELTNLQAIFGRANGQ